MTTLRYTLHPEPGPQESVPLHVLARAYWAAWIALHEDEPTGLHWIDRLGVVIDFGAPERQGSA